jgi:hypothetical protein
VYQYRVKVAQALLIDLSHVACLIAGGKVRSSPDTLAWRERMYLLD